MKKISNVFVVFAVAFVMVLFAGTTSKAATQTNMNVVQTYAGSSAVGVAWSAPLSSNQHYHILMSDGISTVDMGTTTESSETIYGLAKGTVYKLCVAACNGTHSATCTAENATYVSETVYVATALGAVQQITQTNATTSSVSLAWDKVQNATGYRVYVYASGWKLCGQTTTNSIKISGLNASSGEWYRVVPICVTAGGYVVEGEAKSIYDVKTIPAKVAKAAPTSIYSNINVIYFGWTSVNGADGYQLQIQDMKGKNLLYEDQGLSTSRRLSPYWKGKVFKVRARAYVNIGKTKKYGAWSPYSYSCESKKITAVRSYSKKKISLKWKKVSGVVGYDIYISTKSDSGYKKVKALGKKATSCTITKCGKKALSKKKTYYIQLKYKVKVGKKKITTAIVDKATCY